MKNNPAFASKHLRRLAALMLIGLLAACGGGATDPAPVDLKAQYTQAVADAQVALPAEISPHLTVQLDLLKPV